ncbi:MAG: hypothetical protein RLZZ04_1256 [Cyanobacteriota bacterium]|jgi:hypothetical protein
MKPLNCTSADFEQAALARFRSLVGFLPPNSKISRESWGRSTVLCLDFANCPHLISVDQEQARSLSQAIADLGLADSMIFRLGSKIVGWKKVAP